MNETPEQKKQHLNSLAVGAVKALMVLNTAFIIGILTVKKDTIATDIHLVQMQPSNILYCFILSMAFTVMLIFTCYAGKWCDYQVTVKKDNIWYVPGKFAQFLCGLSSIFAFALTLCGFILLSSYFYDDNLTEPYVLPALDYGLYGFHIFIIMLNLFGWLLAVVRPFHRWCVAITTACWLGVGYMLGSIGYCPLTHWHWSVKQKLGATELPDSFITYLLNQVGFTPAPEQVNLWVGVVFGVIVIITLIMWYVDLTADGTVKTKKNRKTGQEHG